MEWLKRMHLKKALFTITFLNLSAALLLSAASFLICFKLTAVIAPQESIIIHDYSAEIDKIVPPPPSAQAVIAADLLSILQILLPVLLFTIALLATASCFYRLKLEDPLKVLMEGADRIIKHDLDFTVKSEAEDELGQLCIAFETMRQSLLKNNKELWKQAEERKRLNAAFSHDLRNPLTVLKGSAKMAKQCAKHETIETAQMITHLNRIETYAGRIEQYIETMSSVQRLEQVQIKKLPADCHALAEELEHALYFMAEDSGKELSFSSMESAKNMLLDKQVFFQTAENLVSNALRFSAESVSVHLSCSNGHLLLEVADDGSGFPETLLKNGIQPFQKYCEDAGHFGMGLYICSLLCQKHDGYLQIQNTPGGASASAVFNIL